MQIQLQPSDLADDVMATRKYEMEKRTAEHAHLSCGENQ